LRPRDVGQVAVEDRLHQRIAARDHVADQEQVGFQPNLLRVPAFDELDALRLQLGAHRRVDVGVAAGHLVACLLRDRSDAAHEGAADAQDVDVHLGQERRSTKDAKDAKESKIKFGRIGRRAETPRKKITASELIG